MRSPILVLRLPKHAQLQSSIGIQCINACRIAPVMLLCDLIPFRCSLLPIPSSVSPCTTLELLWVPPTPQPWTPFKIASLPLYNTQLRNMGINQMNSIYIRNFIQKKEKGVQHQDFPRGHPSQNFSRLSTLNCRVLMGSNALVLV